MITRRFGCGNITVGGKGLANLFNQAIGLGLVFWSGDLFGRKAEMEFG
jgi:hypothetical protein